MLAEGDFSSKDLFSASWVDPSSVFLSSGGTLLSQEMSLTLFPAGRQLWG